MWKFMHDQSFVAFVESRTEGFEGYLDCGELPLHQEPDGQQRVRRCSAEWMTVTSFRERNPHRFWFRCHEHEGTGERRFDIRSWSRITGRDLFKDYCHFDLSHNGYVGLYATPTPPERLWQVVWPDETQVWRAGDDVRLGPTGPLSVLTHQGDALCAYRRTEVGTHWYGYVASSGGPRLSLSLDIQDLGEEEQIDR